MVKNADTGARLSGFKSQPHHCDLGRSLKCSVPQFPYLQNGADHRTEVIGLFRGLDPGTVPGPGCPKQCEWGLLFSMGLLLWWLRPSCLQSLAWSRSLGPPVGCLPMALATPLTLWVVAAPLGRWLWTPPPCCLISARCLAPGCWSM